LKRIFELPNSDAGLKVEKSGVVSEEGNCGDGKVERAARER